MFSTHLKKQKNRGELPTNLFSIGSKKNKERRRKLTVSPATALVDLFGTRGPRPHSHSYLSMPCLRSTYYSVLTALGRTFDAMLEKVWVTVSLPSTSLRASIQPLRAAMMVEGPLMGPWSRRGGKALACDGNSRRGRALVPVPWSRRGGRAPKRDGEEGREGSNVQ